ncbi:hypothetical protein J7T55_008154 [Diaporthe amygdali]|uniref:uncharacterized protein n=1 Tax=Phomopsis amygdali TaxID=1214568 RepID=UPI0022FE281E|nr:uncharacterized protein J7T55_008154 [Diaporthe amygdali]KAJ0108018.1 hypothetical protein J7T55_008154 [Diaporthe amygdali]
MHAFSTPPNQYEIESWLLPHPNVRRLQGARGSAPKRHSLQFMTPFVKETREKETRARLQKGHRRWHSNGHQILQDGPRGGRDTKGKGESLGVGNFKTAPEWSRALGHHPDLPPAYDEYEAPRRQRNLHGHHLVVGDRHLRGDGVEGMESGRGRGDGKLGTSEPKQRFSAFGVPPGVEDQSRGDGKKRHKRCRSHGHLYSTLGAGTLPEKELKELIGGFSSTRGRHGRFLIMDDLSGPSNDAGGVNRNHQSSLEYQHPKNDTWQQDVTESDAEEEPGPAFLGSLDYHNFLHGSSGARATSSSKLTTPASTAVHTKISESNKIELALGDLSDHRPAFKFNSTQQSPVSKLRHQVSQSLSHKPSSKAIKPDLPETTEVPATLTSSTISLSSSLTTAPLLREGTLRSIPSGPLSTISSKEIDPDKLQPFIGPLLPQAPPPTRPLPQLPFPSPVKRREPIKKLFVNIGGQADGSEQVVVNEDTNMSMEEVAERRVSEKKIGKGLRKKISQFFSSDQPARSADAGTPTSYQPLSLTTSQESERISLSDIFDEVYNAARTSLKPGRSSQNLGRSSYQKPDRGSLSDESGHFLPLHGAYESMQAPLTPPSASLYIEPPPLIDHPAVRGDRKIQERLGLINERSVAVPGSGDLIQPLDVPAQSVSRRRLAEIDTGTPLDFLGSALPAPGAAGRARLVKQESESTIIADTIQDIDPSPAFDRTVDLTWFEHALSVFVAKYAKGRPSKKYNGNKRFSYFALPDKLRFEVMRHLFADTYTGKPILLNTKRQACPAWPDDAFDSLGSVLKPLEAIMWACPRLRADAMVVLLLTRKFHVIFSPFVKERSQPLPTTWFFRYLHLMQDVSLELDMTKLGFGSSWGAAGVDPKIDNIHELVRKFTAEIFTRGPANTLSCLTVHCRRYFGYRQGRHEDAEKYPLIGEEDKARSVLPGQARNYDHRAPSLPPSAARPYSGHLRHHADLPHRVPYVTEDHLSVASPLRTLTGRVESVRMVGFSEQWVYATHLSLWPEAERDAVPDAVKHHHIDRQTPSRHLDIAPGHAIYLDYGIDHGVHRYPPLPDSEPRAESHKQSSNLPTPSRASAPVTERFATPAHRQSVAFVPRPSRIPTPSSCRISPTMQAMRKGTPVKAAAVLGLPGTMITSSADELPATPTKPRKLVPKRSLYFLGKKTE